MAVRFAIKSGSWSDPTLWDNGALPQPGDDVYANGFTVTIDTGSVVSTIQNASSIIYLPDMSIPKMTGPSSPSGNAIANAFNGTNYPYLAYDQSNSTSWVSAATSGTEWIGYEFPTNKIIRKYGITVGTVGSVTGPNAWTFEGSNDGSSWTVLDTQISQTPVTIGMSTYSVSSSGSFSYYRLNITARGIAGYRIAISSLEMTESTDIINGGTAGGTFNLNPGVTLTANGAALTTSVASLPIITYSGTGSAATINANIGNSSNNGTVYVSGPGTLRINGNLTGGGFAGAAVTLQAAATLNIVGNLINGEISGNYATALSIGGGGANATINITGNVLNNNGGGNTPFYTALYVQANCTINIIGSVYGATPGGGNSTTRTTFASTQPCTVNITGGVYGGSISSTTINVPAINLTGASTITVTGNVFGGGSSIAPGIFTNGGTCTVIGNIYGGASAQNGAGISPSTATTINLTGNAFGGTSFAAIHATTASPINITGNVNASGTYPGVVATAASAISVNGSIRASNGHNGLYMSNASGVLTMAGNLFNANNGNAAVIAYRMYLTSTPSSWVFSTATSGSNSSLYTTDYAPNFPSVFDVRKDVSYNSGSMIGLMNVPPREAVTYGVPVDNTTGTSALSATSIAQAVWDKLSSEISGSDSIGLRLKNAVTTEVLGQQLASFNNI